MKNNIQKQICFFLAWVLFLTNAVFAYSTEVNFWNERRSNFESKFKNEIKIASLISPQPPFLKNSRVPLINKAMSVIPFEGRKSISKDNWGNLNKIIEQLPFDAGNIQKISIPKSQLYGKVLINIQDVHLNQTAQKNISRVVSSLLNNTTVQIGLLEGAFSPINLSQLKSFRDQNILKTISAQLLDQNRISGPIYSALTNASPIQLIGIDDRTHYDLNVNAYKQSITELKKVQNSLDQFEKELSFDEKKIFNPSLIDFYHRFRAYQQNNLSLGDYVKALRENSPDLPDSLKIFNEALSIESNLNFREVERERSLFINQLVCSLDKGKVDELSRYSLALKSGEINSKVFYQKLKELSEKKGIKLSKLPSLNSYVQYIFLSDSIDSEKLFQEINETKDRIFRNLSKNENEEAFIRNSNWLLLARKLVKFSLSTDEWQEYKKIRNPNVNLKSFEAFYEEAAIRDGFIARNVLSSFQKNSTGFLVAGGFHSKGIIKRLTEEGITVITFVPKISDQNLLKGNDGSEYLRVFAEIKTPLDKILDGEKLFLAQNPIPLRVLNKAAILMAAESFAQMPTPNNKSYLEKWLVMATNWKNVTLTFINQTRVALKSTNFDLRIFKEKGNDGWTISLTPITFLTSFISTLSLIQITKYHAIYFSNIDVLNIFIILAFFIPITKNMLLQTQFDFFIFQPAFPNTSGSDFIFGPVFMTSQTQPSSKVDKKDETQKIYIEKGLMSIFGDDLLRDLSLKGNLTFKDLMGVLNCPEFTAKRILKRLSMKGFLIQNPGHTRSVPFFKLTSEGIAFGTILNEMTSFEGYVAYISKTDKIRWSLIPPHIQKQLIESLALEINKSEYSLSTNDFNRKSRFINEKTLIGLIEANRNIGESAEEVLIRIKKEFGFQLQKPQLLSGPAAIQLLKENKKVLLSELSAEALNEILQKSAEELKISAGELRVKHFSTHFEFLNGRTLLFLISGSKDSLPQSRQAFNILDIAGITPIKSANEKLKEFIWESKYSDNAIVDKIMALPTESDRQSALEQEQALFKEIKNGNIAARDTMFSIKEKLVSKVAWRLARSHSEREELINIGRKTLFRIIEVFSQTPKHYFFHDYAVGYLTGTMSRALNKSRRYSNSLNMELNDRNGQTGLHLLRNNGQLTERNQILDGEKESNDILSGLDSARIRDYVENNGFSKRDKSIFIEYFFGEKTLEEIAQHHQLTRERIRQIKNQALSKVKKVFEEKKSFNNQENHESPASLIFLILTSKWIYPFISKSWVEKADSRIRLLSWLSVPLEGLSVFAFTVHSSLPNIIFTGFIFVGTHILLSRYNHSTSIRGSPKNHLISLLIFVLYLSSSTPLIPILIHLSVDFILLDLSSFHFFSVPIGIVKNWTRFSKSNQIRFKSLEGSKKISAPTVPFLNLLLSTIPVLSPQVQKIFFENQQLEWNALISGGIIIFLSTLVYLLEYTSARLIKKIKQNKQIPFKVKWNTLFDSGLVTSRKRPILRISIAINIAMLSSVMPTLFPEFSNFFMTTFLVNLLLLLSKPNIENIIHFSRTHKQTKFIYGRTASITQDSDGLSFDSEYESRINELNKKPYWQRAELEEKREHILYELNLVEKQLRQAVKKPVMGSFALISIGVILLVTLKDNFPGLGFTLIFLSLPYSILSYLVFCFHLARSRNDLNQKLNMVPSEEANPWLPNSFDLYWKNQFERHVLEIIQELQDVQEKLKSHGNEREIKLIIGNISTRLAKEAAALDKLIREEKKNIPHLHEKAEEKFTALTLEARTIRQKALELSQGSLNPNLKSDLRSQIRGVGEILVETLGELAAIKSSPQDHEPVRKSFLEINFFRFIIALPALEEAFRYLIPKLMGFDSTLIWSLGIYPCLQGLIHFYFIDIQEVGFEKAILERLPKRIILSMIFGAFYLTVISNGLPFHIENENTRAWIALLTAIHIHAVYNLVTPYLNRGIEDHRKWEWPLMSLTPLIPSKLFFSHFISHQPFFRPHIKELFSQETIKSLGIDTDSISTLVYPAVGNDLQSVKNLILLFPKIKRTFFPSGLYFEHPQTKINFENNFHLIIPDSSIEIHLSDSLFHNFSMKNPDGNTLFIDKPGRLEQLQNPEGYYETFNSQSLPGDLLLHTRFLNQEDKAFLAAIAHNPDWEEIIIPKRVYLNPQDEWNYRLFKKRPSPSSIDLPPAQSLDLSHAFDGSYLKSKLSGGEKVEKVVSNLENKKPTIKIIHLREPSDLELLKKVEKNSTNIFVVAKELEGKIIRPTFGKNSVLVFENELPRVKTSELYSYEDLLNQPQVRKLADVDLLFKNNFSNGSLIIITRHSVPFMAGEYLTRIIQLITSIGDGWIQVPVETIIKSSQSALKAA